MSADENKKFGMAAVSRFSENVSEEELNALIQKAIPEETEIARKYNKV